MSDRIAVINEGRLVQVPDSKSIYYKPQDRFVASFVGESSLLPCRIGQTKNGTGTVSIVGRVRGMARLNGQSDGESGWLFARPEHVDISPRGVMTDVPNTLDGVVEDALFLGESTRYVVRCEDERITIKQQNRRQTQFSSGTAVIVSWNADNCIVLN
ncbi:TOBE domain-containing protein [Ensifer aridi]|uniref:TOBE domain-containing protein n=1 Tax=Ensifer aridi TaxID=1708715 RepID=UPI001FCDDB21|nr:TOBE domain-containing protein [Ensifer aridi]